jgi:DNA-binding NtrC family response regulator
VLVSFSGRIVPIVQGTATVSLASDPLAPEENDSKEAPVLVLAWSLEEPARVGEVAHAGALGQPFVLGRGDDGGADRIRFFRQRPQEKIEAPPLEGKALSRRQLILKRFAGGLEVENIGRCSLLVNGVPTEKAAVTPGDVLWLRGQLVLFCAARQGTLPAARYFPQSAWGPFGEPDATGILGESPATWRLRDQLAFAAKSGTHVLLRGDSGTGKELAARAIHRLSERSSKPLVCRNAATFPPGLIDAELFGNARNYPNPGTPERAGLIGQAHGGTLFLDEIGELPEDMQAHLLRVLDEGGEYQRLGEATPRRSDLRLVGATNRAPSSLKHDLLARLAGRIELAPIDRRREDIPLLVRHLVLRAAEKSPEIAGRFVVATQAGRTAVRVDGALVDGLLRKRFETNVRELDAVLWQAMAESPGDVVVRPATLDDSPSEHSAAAKVTARADSAPAPRPPGREPSGEQIRAMIVRERGNVRKAAAALGLPSRYALYRLMRKHGIDPKAFEIP